MTAVSNYSISPCTEALKLTFLLATGGLSAKHLVCLSRYEIEEEKVIRGPRARGRIGFRLKRSFSTHISRSETD